MPVTPFYLGPALATGLPLRKFIHAPTFIIADIILDLDPLFCSPFQSILSSTWIFTYNCSRSSNQSYPRICSV